MTEFGRMYPSVKGAVEMEYCKLAMYRPNLEDIPAYSLKDGYRLKLFKEGDEIYWAEIESSAGEFKDVNGALKHFEKEFSEHADEIKRRCAFLISPDNEYIGTTTAWFGDFNGKRTGRIHWVAIKPLYQGKGLAKPMFSYALNIMAKYHDSAYLTTQTTSWRAINMYLSYQFQPIKCSPEDPDFEKGWELVYRQLGRRNLY